MAPRVHVAHLTPYRQLLWWVRLPLALVAATLLALNVQQAWARYERSAMWDRRRADAARAAAAFRASMGDNVTLEALFAESAATEAATEPPLVARLRALDAGPPVWAAYADAVERRLRAAGCGATALGKARQWVRPTFNGRRRPDAPVLARAANGSASKLDACTPVLAEAAAAAALHAEIAASQTVASPAHCASPDARILLLTYPWNGWASSFGVVAGALMTARRMGRLLVLDESTRWVHYGGQELCGGGATQWECYFQRFGSCDFASAGITPEEAAAAPPATAWVGVPPEDGPRVVRMSQESQYASLFYHSHLTALRPPPPYARYGNAWWRTHHFLHLWRLRPAVAGAVARRAASSGLSAMGPRFLAWHVRHGDKVREGRGVFRTSKYAAALEALAAAHPDVTDVFLASDDPGVLAEARALRPFASGALTLHALTDARRLGGEVVEAAEVARADPTVAFALAVDAIANVAVLSEGALAVGIFHSNFARLASEFRYAKGLAGAPFVFRDADDCARRRHVHPDRDSYFVPNATAWYLPMRAARRALGLPPGFFVPPGSEASGGAAAAAAG